MKGDYEKYLLASGVSEPTFLRMVADIRKRIGAKPKHRPRYISDL